MSLVLKVGKQRELEWQGLLQQLLPDIECKPWDNPGPLDLVEYAAVWNPPRGGLKQFVNLKLIISIGAGVDHLLSDIDLPTTVPIIRTVSDDLCQRMREYIVLHVLRLHRRLPEIERAQATHNWTEYVEPLAQRVGVGVLGLGNIGTPVAITLASIGYSVMGWSASAKTLPGVRTFSGDVGLSQIAEHSDILICLLPLTSKTRNILNRDLFSSMPRGSSIINVGRGEHLAEGDLISALDSGQLRAATLDCFREEPLPPCHPFWSDPRILITAHTAGFIDPESGGRIIAANIKRFKDGARLEFVDRTRSY